MAGFIELIKTARKEQPDATATDIARTIYDQLDEEEILVLIAREVNLRLREFARAQEQVAFVEMFHSAPIPSGEPTSRGLLPPPSDALRSLFQSTFVLGDGRTSTWGQATVAEHRARIRYLEMMSDGLIRTAGYHERAIEIIEDAGVTCLAQAPSAAPALAVLLRGSKRGLPTLAPA